MATTAANLYLDIVRPPPLKFEVERAPFSSKRSRKPLEYNFNYFHPSFDISSPENFVNSSTDGSTDRTNYNDNILSNQNDRCRSLTPKKSLKDSSFRISPNSAFTPISLPTKKQTAKICNASKSFDEVAGNSGISFRSNAGSEDPQASMKTATSQQSTTTKSTKINSNGKVNNKDMPDRETNLEYALNINPSLSEGDYQRHGDTSPGGLHYDMAMERAKIKPVVYQHKWSITPEYLEKIGPNIPIIESVKKVNANLAEENRRRNPTISTSLYVGDTDLENKQNFWHKVFKFEQKSDPSINDERRFIIDHNKYPPAQNPCRIVDQLQKDKDQEHYRRKYTPSNNILRKQQKHASKTICIFPDREKAAIEKIDFIAPKFNDPLLNDDGQMNGVKKSISSQRPLRVDDQEIDNENIVVERLLTNSTNNNVLGRAQIFEKIAQKQSKSIAAKPNNVPFLKKIGNYFSSKLSATTMDNNNDNEEKLLKQKSKTLRLPLKTDGENSTTEFSYSNKVLRRFSDICGQSDYRNLATQKQPNIIYDESEDEEEENADNLPAHEDRSSKMNIGEKTKLFELKSQIHLKQQDDLDSYSKKRVSFVEDDHSELEGAEKSSIYQRRRFRTNKERRKTQPVTQEGKESKCCGPRSNGRHKSYSMPQQSQQAEIDKARTFSNSANDVNYQAHRFIQTGLERAASKGSIVDYYAPNFKVKDDEACKKQAKQLSKCKKVSLW